jgi:hypothetical protein
MSPKEAEADALRRFGAATVALEKSYEADIFLWLETILQDMRYGARSLRRNPGVTAVALLSLALAIGANTAIFSVVNAVLWRALPYKEPDRIATLWMTNTLREARMTVSVPNFDDWKKRAQSFEALAGYRQADGSFATDGEPGWIAFTWVHGDFFRLLGRKAALGRASDTEGGETHGLVLSHRFWQSRFGGSPDVIGKTVNVSGVDFHVMGVMPEDFSFPSRETQLWAPARALSDWQSRRAIRQGGSFLSLDA